MIPYPKRERTFPPRPGTQSLRVDNLSFPRTSPVSVEMARHQEYLRPRSMPITVPQNPEPILRAPFPWSLLVVLYATTRGTAFSWYQGCKRLLKGGGMKVMTAREPKNRTGEALRHVARGSKVVITRRGKPWAILGPAGEATRSEPLAPVP